MKKKLLLMTLMLLCAVAQGAWADKWDGQTLEKPQFQPTLGNVIVITKASELAYIREHFTEETSYVSSAAPEYYNQASYLLMADIDMGDDVSWEPFGSHPELWPHSSYEKGTFNGNGHTIRIHIMGAENTAESNWQGLFRHIYKTGTVKNLHVDGIVECSDSRLVGGICGENDGTIENCWVSADVSSGWKEPASAYTAKVGGIAGENSGTIKYCCMTGNVSNNDADVGGLVGDNDGGTIDHCTFYGTVSSTHSQDNSFVGDQDGTLTNHHDSFTGDELATYLTTIDMNYTVYRKALQEPYTITVNNETEDALTSSPEKAYPGQTITLNTEDGSSIVHIKVNDAGGSLLAEWYTPFENLTFTMPRRNVTVTTTNAPWEGEGTEEDPYLISTPGEWEQIHKQMMEATASDDIFSGTYFKQTADIDIKQGLCSTGQSNSKSFCGTYDGGGHRLNCSLTNPVSGSTEAVAPFHKVKNATIKNLYVTGTISGGIHTAGLVAYTEGTVNIDNCRVAADISCTGNDRDNAHGGGFVGHALESDITVTDCLFDGSLKASANDGDGTRLGAIIGFSGKKTTVNRCVENATFTTAGQTAFCWKDQGSATINDYYGNRHLTDFSQVSGADKLYSVSSGTEELELVFPENCYEWQEAYHGALFKLQNDNAVVYLIGGQFYTIESSIVQFDVKHPELWTDVKVYIGETEKTKNSSTGLYSFKQESANTVITATHGYVSWTDEGNYATEFTTVDTKNKIVTIKTCEELARLAKLVYSGEDSGDGWTYKLDADLDMSAYHWTPIGNGLSKRFLGSFDGQGHTISGITIKGTSLYAGLFGVVNGQVLNLKLVNSSIEGRRFVGGIAGEVRYDIVNCYVGDDVTVKAVTANGPDDGQDCGGVVGRMQNQDANHGYPVTDAYVRGCYSAATVSGVSHVGGIVGNMLSGTVHYNVSQAKASISGTDGTVAYIVGNKLGGNTPACNFYISDTESENDTDTRAFHITLSDELKKAGYSITESTNENFDVSELYFRQRTYNETLYVNQIKVGDEWYGPKFYNIGGSQYQGGQNVVFYFSVTKEIEGYQMAALENVKVNGEDPETTSSGDYYLKVDGDAVITGDPAITLYDDSNVNNHDMSKFNENILYCNNGLKVNATIQGRTLYKNNNWNTICLPFDLTISGSLLDGADVRTLESSSYDGSTSTLTLNFTNSLDAIEAGKPYIIKWKDGDDIVNPKFEDVTISFDNENDPYIIGEEDVDPVQFGGNYMQSTFPPYEEGYRNFLYMGADNLLYYPDGTDYFTINCFRAYFKLRDDLEAGDPDNGVKAFKLNFGDGEATGIITTDFTDSADENDSWFTIDGRRLSGQPAQPGIYIHNGQKVMMK